jgi:hypothetical protein
MMSFLFTKKINVIEAETEKYAEKENETEKKIRIGKDPGNPHLLGEEAQNLQ